ncbi:unnamed protein product [Acanthoscelides obtectus]|uniref:Uncharacterized protein n=1 Tax=Acanthoscelides obtectus TaxID=200917 RepID=A0A9P0K415_ACAOB|nr:unnamed protein product [Acanthoscelides obtectus]CAK1665881.1 hypothetical protein AOBTE_LOCUS25021 [Acanthoscelides obtectus]
MNRNNRNILRMIEAPIYSMLQYTKTAIKQISTFLQDKPVFLKIRDICEKITFRGRKLYSFTFLKMITGWYMQNEHQLNCELK